MLSLGTVGKGRLAGIVVCLSSLFFFGLTSSACSESSTQPVLDPVGPITLTIGLPVQTGQDPLHGAVQASRLISREGLTLPNRTGRVQARLAESWEESSDGLTWRFKLRSNALFHDGTRVDAVAVKASLQRSLATSDIVQYPGLADIVSVEAPSDSEVVINLSARSTFLLDDLGVSILKHQSDGPAIGAGPYVSDSTSENELTMRAFEKYYRGAPKIDRIVWKAYPTVRTAWAAMMRGEIDFLYEVGQDTREFIEGENSVAVFPFLRNYVYAVALNSKKTPFDDARVRRALNHSVNRAAIVRQGFKGHGTPQSGSAWPQHWAYDTDVPTFAYEPQRATALLDAAGVPPADLQADRDKPPARLRFTCILPEGFPLWEKIGLLAQRDFSAIGVDMNLEAVSVQEFNTRILSGNFDAVLSEFIVGNSPSRPFTFWYSKSRQNLWGYRNQKVDDALLGIRRASSEVEYRDAFRDFQLNMLDDPPAVFLALGENSRAVSKRFRVVAPAGSDILPTIADWQLGEGPPRLLN
jgi:peptide/nickel transport system substrate-binding protein